MKQRGSIFGSVGARGDVAYLSGLLLKKTLGGRSWTPMHMEIRSHYMLWRQVTVVKHGDHEVGWRKPTASPVLGGVDLGGAQSYIERYVDDVDGSACDCLRVVGLDSAASSKRRALVTVEIRYPDAAVDDYPSLRSWEVALNASKIVLRRDGSEVASQRAQRSSTIDEVASGEEEEEVEVVAGPKSGARPNRTAPPKPSRKPDASSVGVPPPAKKSGRRSSTAAVAQARKAALAMAAADAARRTETENAKAPTGRRIDYANDSPLRTPKRGEKRGGPPADDGSSMRCDACVVC